jgi:NADP-dependent 3-hydroxy acid dehydrogenase YdfG
MVTGGTSGIGFAIAERFMQEGALTIILVGRSQERLQKAAEKLSIIDGTETSSDKVRLVVGDVGKAGTWIRELEKEMVSPSQIVMSVMIYPILTECTGRCRCFSQCSWNIDFKNPSKT